MLVLFAALIFRALVVRIFGAVVVLAFGALVVLVVDVYTGTLVLLDGESEVARGGRPSMTPRAHGVRMPHGAFALLRPVVQLRVVLSHHSSTRLR